MGKLYYFCARPETVVSFVRVGHMPDNMSEYLKTKQIVLYENIETCVSTTGTNYHQTFIVELLLPDVLDSDLLTEVIDTEIHQTTIQAAQINTEWIQRIDVYSAKAKKLLQNLFNRKLTIPVIRDKTLFPAGLIPQTLAYEDQVLEQSQSGITYITKGDLLGSQMQTLVNTVNCVGVMGKGIAFGFKLRYQQMFEDYKERCKRGEVKLGKPYLYRVNEKRLIVNFPTKNHWRQKAHLEDIETGLRYLAAHIEEWGITSIAIPPLGCGNGGLDWNDVKPLIKKYIEPCHIQIEIYVPFAYRNSLKRKPPMDRFFVRKRRPISYPIPEIDQSRNESKVERERKQFQGTN